MWDVDSGGDCVCAVVKDLWELSIVSAQFFCEPKTAKKKKKLFTNLKKGNTFNILTLLPNI